MNSTHTTFAAVLLAALALPAFTLAAEEGDKPTTRPATRVTPQAKSELDALAAAYKGLDSLALAGTITGDFQASGDVQSFSDTFTASYTKNAGFRHEMKDDLVLGSTGKKVYTYQPKRKLYTQADAPAAAGDLPAEVAGPLQSQNPSLTLALAADPAAALTAGAAKVDRGADVAVDGSSKPLPTLSVTGPDVVPATFAIDPETHLLRRATFDLSDSLKKRGATDVKKALITIDYTRTTPDAPAGKPDQYAWAPPEGARDAAAAADAGDGGGAGEAAQSLVGKPAPELALTNLDGSAFSLAKYKGSVVVLDFWATWCGPCVAALPHLDGIYKDKQAAGLKVFAVNQGEEADTVKKFIDAKKISIPVVMDPNGEGGAKYKVEGIPETVVINRDGTVRKVFVGFDADAVAKAIDAALGK